MSWLAELLQKADWGEFEPEHQALQVWEHYDLLVDSIHNLKRETLFHSHIHGEGHIERVLLHGAMLAMRHRLERSDVALLLDACSYHDTGRVDDSVDHDHGARSARKLAGLTNWQEQDLQVLQAVVEAHSRWDGELEKIIQQYQVEDVERASKLALLLKDADGLDRVRLNDLDVKYLRWAGSGERKGFAEWMFQNSREWEKQASTKAAEISKSTEFPKGLVEAATQFGVDGSVYPLNGGEGRTWCVGGHVFKPMGESEQTDWICAILTNMKRDGFRTSYYRKTKNGKWSHLGWTCCCWLDGEEVKQGSTTDWLRVMQAGCAFQRGLSKLPRPAWMGQQSNIYALGDLMAWGEKPARMLPVFAPLFEALMTLAASSANAPCQLIHGDLSGNVLLHPEFEPGIIDFSPYWRPFLMGPATVAADALLWHRADGSLLQASHEEYGQEFLPFVARGLVFRLAISNIALTERGNQADGERELLDYQRAMTILDQLFN